MAVFAARSSSSSSSSSRIAIVIVEFGSFPRNHLLILIFASLGVKGVDALAAAAVLVVEGRAPFGVGDIVYGVALVG